MISILLERPLVFEFDSDLLLGCHIHIETFLTPVLNAVGTTELPRVRADPGLPQHWSFEMSFDPGDLYRHAQYLKELC
jgi:hypothetical protein